MQKTPSPPHPLKIWASHGFLWALLVMVWIQHCGKIPLMGDELVTYFIGTLPPKNILTALQTGADSHGPIYYLLTHCWLQIAPIPVEFWGRLPSLLCWASSGSLLLYILQKKGISPLISLTLTLTLFSHPQTLKHLAELRSYGWMIFLITLQIALLEALFQKKDAQNLKTLPLLLATAACSSASALSHPMALLFSGTAVTTYCLSFLNASKKPLSNLITNPQCRDPLIAWSLGLLTLAPWLLAFFDQSQAVLSSASRWAEPPTLNQLWRFLQPPTLLIPLTLLLLLSSPHTTLKKIQTWICLSLSFLCLAILLWIASQWTNPLFTPRYLLPIQLTWILTCASLLPQIPITKTQSLMCVTATLLLATTLINSPPPPRSTTGGFWTKENPWQDIGLGEKKYLTLPNIPIACETSTTYLPRKFYQPTPNPYVLLLPPNPKGVHKMDRDMNQALSKIDTRQTTQTLHHFLKTTPRFYLLNEKNSPIDTLIPNSYQKTQIYSSQKQGEDDSLTIELFEKTPHDY